jgi:hypothetical protein
MSRGMVLEVLCVTSYFFFKKKRLTGQPILSPFGGKGGGGGGIFCFKYDATLKNLGITPRGALKLQVRRNV